MKTYYPVGQNIFFDSASANDKLCAITVTSLSGHLVGIYTTVRTLTFTTVYGKVVTASGIMPPPFTVPDDTDHNQKDAHVAAIDGTDDFVVVWTSNTTGNYLTWIRRFRVMEDGRVIPVSATAQLSNSGGDHMAPRVVFLPVEKLFLVIWISVHNHDVQYRYVACSETEGSFENITDIAALNDTVDRDYFSTDLDICNDKTLSLCVINTPTRVIAALKRSHNEVGVYEILRPESGHAVQQNLPVYQVDNISKFDIGYDPRGSVKIVYVHTGSSPIYGDTLVESNLPQATGGPLQLNQLYQPCGRPVIVPVVNIAPPAAASASAGISYMVGWEIDGTGCFFNRFNADFFALGGETGINSNDAATDNLRLSVTDNQIATVFQASKNEALHLGENAGILMHVYYLL